MLLLRGATDDALSIGDAQAFQYMLLLRGATASGNLKLKPVDVSIHAPLARSNISSLVIFTLRKRFNTCSSCEEQQPDTLDLLRATKFQYMLLLRGATRGSSSCQRVHSVSIHAPLARSNKDKLQRIFDDSQFQYMLLLRGATSISAYGCNIDGVSIHAPLARSNSASCAHSRNFPFQYMLLLRGAT